MKFVVWAPPFDDASGGVIALHLLCHRLVEQGEDAYIWPAMSHERRPLWRKLLFEFKAHLTGKYRRYRLGPFVTPIAARKMLRDAIVVYPEIVEGNPLGARHVVRWLLNKPGFFTDKTDYDENDLFFFYQDAFNDPQLNPHPDRLLRVTWINEAYRKYNEGARSGSCFLIKKGAGREIVHDLRDSIQIDALSHEEKARVFNETERFYSYDLYTMYSMYAALCGCDSVVVPDPQLSVEDWMPEESRYGIAYGEDQLAWAAATREILLNRLDERRQEEDRTVENFVRQCRIHFHGSG